MHVLCLLSTLLATHVLFQNTHYSEEEGRESRDKDEGIESHDEEEVCENKCIITEITYKLYRDV